MNIHTYQSMYTKCFIFCFTVCHLVFSADSLVLAESTGRVRTLSGGRQLQISIAKKSDAGLYTCVASNVAGITKKDYNLQVYSKSLISQALAQFSFKSFHPLLLLFPPCL